MKFSQTRTLWLLVAIAGFGSAIALGQPAQAIDDNDGFILPSKNIACISHDMPDADGNNQPTLRCEILSKLNPMPVQPASCEFDWGNGLQLTKEEAEATVLCVGDTMYSPNYPTLDYGNTWKKNGFSCKSSTNGLTCTNGKGNGFFLNREEWKAF
jgi:hypothetical protein